MTEHTPTVVIREIDAWNDEALRAVAAVHARHLDFGPLAALGEPFLREVCYRAPMRDSLLRVAVAEVDGQVGGFVAFTADSAEFHARALKGHLALAGWWAARALVSAPRRLAAVPRILRVFRSRVSDAAPTRPHGEVIGLAVLPAVTTAEFRKRSGSWVSRDLIATAARLLHDRGVDSLRMFVAAENRAALIFYQALGGQFERVEHGGEPTVAISFPLHAGASLLGASADAMNTSGS